MQTDALALLKKSKEKSDKMKRRVQLEPVNSTSSAQDTSDLMEKFKVANHNDLKTFFNIKDTPEKKKIVNNVNSGESSGLLVKNGNVPITSNGVNHNNGIKQVSDLKLTQKKYCVFRV